MLLMASDGQKALRIVSEIDQGEKVDEADSIWPIHFNTISLIRVDFNVVLECSESHKCPVCDPPSWPLAL